MCEVLVGVLKARRSLQLDRLEAKAGAKVAEPKPEAKVEVKPEAKVEPKVEVKAEPAAAPIAKAEPAAAPVAKSKTVAASKVGCGLLDLRRAF